MHVYGWPWNAKTSKSFTTLLLCCTHAHSLTYMYMLHTTHIYSHPTKEQNENQMTALKKDHLPSLTHTEREREATYQIENCEFVSHFQLMMMRMVHVLFCITGLSHFVLSHFKRWWPLTHELRPFVFNLLAPFSLHSLFIGHNFFRSPIFC